MRLKTIVRHAIASAVVVGGCVALIGATYFALLAWAILVGGGIGGPLALPGMLLVAFFGALASVVAVLAPVTLIAEWLRVRLLRANRFVEIPIATVLVALYIFGVCRTLPWSAGPIVIAIELILAGVYWWSLQITDLVIVAAAKGWTLLQRRAAASY